MRWARGVSEGRAGLEGGRGSPGFVFADDAGRGLVECDIVGQLDIAFGAMVFPVGVGVEIAILWVVPGQEELYFVKAGVEREIGEDATDGIGGFVVQFDRFAYGVLVAEQCIGRVLGEQDRGGVF